MFRKSRSFHKTIMLKKYIIARPQKYANTLNHITFHRGFFHEKLSLFLNYSKHHSARSVY